MKKIYGIWQTVGMDGTARMYAKDTSLTSLPKEVRECMVAPDGYVWVGFDYSNADLRCLADAFGDEGLIAILNDRSKDVHSEVWALMNNIPPGTRVEKADRMKSKIIAYGTIYSGGDPYSISNQLKISLHEAKLLRDKLFEKFPRLKAGIEATVNKALTTYHVRSYMDRMRKLRGSNTGRDRARMANQALNAIGQQGVGTVIKLAIRNVYAEKAAGNPAFQSIFQCFPVFDACYWLVKREDVDMFIAKAKPLVEVKLNKVIMFSEWKYGESLGRVS